MPDGLSKDDLVQQAKTHYRDAHWRVPIRLSKPHQQLVSDLSLRPDFIAQRDGMEHLVYASGKVTRSTFNLLKQVAFELDQMRCFCHIVVACDNRISKGHEQTLRKMGIGIILVRQGVPNVKQADPELRCFRLPTTFHRIPRRYRPGVRQALDTIRFGDVCVGVLDLAQVLETALANRGVPAKTLGGKIKDAKANGVLRSLAADAAKRVNSPRIQRAHPKGHTGRRNAIVIRVQEIVDDCLAVLFSLD